MFSHTPGVNVFPFIISKVTSVQCDKPPHKIGNSSLGTKHPFRPITEMSLSFKLLFHNLGSMNGNSLLSSRLSVELGLYINVMCVISLYCIYYVRSPT